MRNIWNVYININKYTVNKGMPFSNIFSNSILHKYVYKISINIYQLLFNSERWGINRVPMSTDMHSIEWQNTNRFFTLFLTHWFGRGKEKQKNIVK